MHFLYFVFLFLISSAVNAQSFDWVNEIEYDSDAFDYSTHFKTQADGDGNIFNIVNNDVDGVDIDFHLEKRDPDGTLLWTKDWTGAEEQIALATTIDSEGNVLILGRFRSTVDFDPNDGVFEVEAEGLEWNGLDLFLLKLDNDGNFLWVFSEGPDEDFEGLIGSAIGIDSDDNIFITGQFEGHFIFGDDQYIHTTAGALNHFHDNFIVKFDPTGICLWVNYFEGGEGYGSDAIYSVTSDEENNIYLVGDFIIGLDFNPDPGETDFLTVLSDYRDGYILKINEAGNYLWAKQIGGGDIASCRDIKIDSNGDVLCTGFAKGLIDYDPSDEEFILGGDDIDQYGFVLKLNNLGAFIWAKEFQGDIINMNSIALDSDDHIYLTGFYSSEMNLTPAPMIMEVESAGSTDFFIIKLDENGAFNWGTSLGYTEEDKAEGILVTADGSIIISGEFKGTVDFNPSDDIDELMDPEIINNTFLLKFDACDLQFEYDTINSCDALTWIDDNIYTESNEIALVKHLDAICDSVYYMNYTRLPSFDSTYTPSSCTPYVWIDGVSYDHDTTLLLIYENIHGCDSTLFLEFDYIEPLVIADSLVTCEPFIWLDGETYYDDTLLTYTYTSDEGCDSIRSMKLTYPFTYYSLSPSDCYSYTWIDGNTYYNDTLIIDTLYNPLGCDTIGILNLSIEDEAIPILDEVNACISYLWIDDITYTNDTIVSILIDDPFGCDTLKTLELEITAVNTNLTLEFDIFIAMEDDAIYTWLNCDDFSVIPGETSQTYAPETYGEYAVIIEKDGCIDTSECLLFFIDDASIITNELDKITLYPNPGAGSFNLNLPLNQNLKIEIIDLNGRVIETFNPINQENFLFEINAAAGIYKVMITSKSNVQSIKLIKL